MQLQIEPFANNQHFSGIKIRKTNINPRKVKKLDSNSIERKMAAIGWGMLITGLLAGVVQGGKTYIDKSKEKKYLLTPEQIELKKSVNTVCDSTCMILKKSSDSILKHVNYRI